MDLNWDLVQQILIICVFANSSEMRGAGKAFLLPLLQKPRIHTPQQSPESPAQSQLECLQHCASFSHAVPPLLFPDFQPPAIPVSGISWGEAVSCDGLCILSVMGASNHWGIGLMHSFHLWLGLNLNLFLQRNNKTLNYYDSNLLK